MSIGKAERETPPYVSVLTAASAASLTQVPLNWTSFKPPWGIQRLDEFSQWSRPVSRSQSKPTTPNNVGPGDASRGAASPTTSRTASPNAIRPKTGNGVRSNRSPTATCSKGTFIPGSVPPKLPRRFHSSSLYRLKFNKLRPATADTNWTSQSSRKSSPNRGLDAEATSRSNASAAYGGSRSPRRSTALAKFVDEILNGEATPNEIGQDLSFFKTWFQQHLAKTSKVKSLEISLEAILNKSYEATKDHRNAPDALRTAVAFSALEHIIPVSGRFQAVLVLIRRILSEAVYGVFPLGQVVNVFDAIPFFNERESFQRTEKELKSLNAQLQHDLDLQKKQMSRCIDRLDSVKGEYFELKEKYVSSGQQRDKLSENAQSLRIKADSLEMQNKDAIAEASESRRALDDFKAGIDKVSADMQFALVVSKAQLEEERKKNAILIRQNLEMRSNMIEKNDFVAFQVFTQLELQHKRKGTPFAKPAPDAPDYMNIALINALEFLEGLRDK